MTEPVTAFHLNLETKMALKNDSRLAPRVTPRHPKESAVVVARTLRYPPDTEINTSGRGRTDTPLREQDFESSASANFATPASGIRDLPCRAAVVNRRQRSVTDKTAKQDHLDPAVCLPQAERWPT